MDGFKVLYKVVDTSDVLFRNKNGCIETGYDDVKIGFRCTNKRYDDTSIGYNMVEMVKDLFKRTMANVNNVIVFFFYF